jgi:site-specific recombinase XerC
MTAIHRDYLPERKEPAFPRELAALIARKAQRMAAELEAKAARQMVTAARRSLRDGMTAAEVARQLGL